MAMNFLRKLFSRDKKRTIGMTAEEAYAPRARDDAPEWFDMPPGYPENAPETPPDAEERVSADAAGDQPLKREGAAGGDNDAEAGAEYGAQKSGADGSKESAAGRAGDTYGAADGDYEAADNIAMASGKTSDMSFGDDAPFEDKAPYRADTPFEEEATYTNTAPGGEGARDADAKPRELWLYACMDNPRVQKAMLRSKLISIFGALSEDENAFTGRLPSGARVRVQLNLDEAVIREQTGYLKAQYQQVSMDDKAVQHAALMQIELFNAMITYTLTPPYTEADGASMLNAAFAAARVMHAFVLNAQAELYRWDEKLLIAPDGRTEFNVFMPMGYPTSAQPKGRASYEDDARVERSLQLMRAHGLTDDNPPPVQTRASEARLRSPGEIVTRMAAVFACALQAQAYSSPNEIGTPAAWARNALSRLEAQYGVNRAFTRKEAQYCLKPSPAQHAAYLNGFEACATMLWALGLIGLAWPSEHANLSNIMRVVRDADTDMLMRIAKPRSVSDVLDMHDVTYRLHRACLRAEFDGKPLSELDADVVYERHYALNWLVATDGITDWDMVVPKT